MRSLLLLVPLLVLSCGGSQPKPAQSGPVSKTPFTAQHIEGLGDPEIIVENRSDKVFTIALTGATPMTLEVPAHGKQSIRLKAGTYGYNASAPNILPLDGQHAFAKDMRYTWVFFIEKTSVDDPKYAGKGWHCFEVKSQPISYYVCGREKAHCDQLHAQPAKPDEPPIGECAPQAVTHSFVDTVRDIAVFALDKDACDKLRTSYLKQASDPTKVTACEEKK